MPCWARPWEQHRCDLFNPTAGHPCAQVKAFDAHLDSGGGAVAGSVTGVDVRVRSAGGPVSLKSLVGKRAEVHSDGGAVTLGACYADQLSVQSGEVGVRCSSSSWVWGGRSFRPGLHSCCATSFGRCRCWG